MPASLKGSRREVSSQPSVWHRLSPPISLVLAAMVHSSGDAGSAATRKPSTSRSSGGGSSRRRRRCSSSSTATLVLPLRPAAKGRCPRDLSPALPSSAALASLPEVRFCVLDRSECIARAE